MDKTRLIIASTQRLFRECLALALNKEQHLEVVGETAEVSRLIETGLPRSSDILILDTCGSGLTGIEAVRLIKSRYPDIRVIALSQAAVPHYIWKMITLGVTGYLLKSTPLEKLKTAICLVAAGKIHLCPEVAGVLVKTICAKESQGHLVSTLSGRELEVLQLIAEGYKPGDIAKKLFISPKTVQIHQSNLKRKLNLTSTAGLTKYAISKGITSLDFIPRPPTKT